MGSWFTSAIVKAVLDYLFGILDSFIEKEKAKREAFERGQQEVREALDRKEREIAQKLEERRQASANTTFDDAIRELLDSASDAKRNEVPSNTKPNS